MTEEVFIVKPVSNKVYDVAKFGDDKRVTGDKEAISVSRVTISKNYTHCSCMGFKMQKNKSEHKHCLLVQFIKENIKDCVGYAFWFENNVIKYNKFFEKDYIERKLNGI